MPNAVTPCSESVWRSISTMHFTMLPKALVNTFKEGGDFEGFRLEVIVNFGMDTKITAEEFNKDSESNLAARLYEEASASYQNKRQAIMQNAVPVFKNIRQSQGAHIVNVVVPFSDGRRALQVLANLDKTVNSNGAELVHALEKQLHSPTSTKPGRSTFAQWTI